jgi:S-DNA-T family DNA segregation ATPase FtsK/SpoIIIE
MNSPSLENPFEADRLNEAANFRPEWDVGSSNARVSDWINREVEAIRRQPAADERRKIAVLLGQPGYGKTHLFGRIQHQQEQQVFFVFVPQVLNARRPAAHVHWHVVESLFQAGPGPHSRLAGLLARLLRPSFEDYFDRLPPALACRHEALRQRLEDDPLAVLEIVVPIAELAPFHKLADSLALAFPQLQADILRAVVLGWSPATLEARRWLRGESLPEGRLDDLQLGQEPPAASRVLQAVAVMLQRLNMPVVLCLDQMEAFLKDEQGPKEITTELMGWLHDITNLLLVVSCLDGIEWKTFGPFKSFMDRVEQFQLAPLSGIQARELVHRRLRSWNGYRPERAECWPFLQDSIERFAQKNPLSPRGFLKVCAQRFGQWLDKRSDVPIKADDGGSEVPSLEQLFVQEWNQGLLAIQKAALSPENQQEEHLFKAVHEALKTVQEGKVPVGGVAVLSVQERAIRPSKTDPRPSLALRLGVGPSAFSVVVAVTKKDSGVPFGTYMEALEGAMGGDVIGTVLVRPTAALTVGPKAKARAQYEKAVGSEKLRPFPLDSERLDFEQLECLLQLLQKAEVGDLQLTGRALSVRDCRRLILELKLLNNLKLFKFIFEGWPAVEAARSAQGPSSHAEADSSTTAENRRTGQAAGGTDDSAAAGRGGGNASAGARPAGADSPPPPGGETGPQAWAEGLLARVVEKLRAWGQPVKAQGFEVGPTFARLKVTPQDQTDINKVRNKAENLGIHLQLPARPLISSQAGYISIDVQRPDRQTVALGQVLATRPAGLRGQPAFPVGVDVAGRAHWLNLADPATCHLLIAGTTGSGKSEFMKAMLAGLAHELAPDQLQLVLIDPKQVTFNFKGSSPYLPKPIAYDVNDALPLIEEYFEEMERRYTLLRQRHKENIAELTGADAVPRIVLVFDEFADLMLERGSKKELETLLKRLGAKARAAGLHLVLGTQRTEASVVTPLLRSNLPGRVSLKVTSDRDSKLILDAPDAANLLGRGDLFWRQGGGLLRLQSPFVSREDLDGHLRIV